MHDTLLSPGKIGQMSVRNRIVVTAMGTGYAEADGTCGTRAIGFFDRVARGGVGLVISGAIGVGLPLGRVLNGQLGISEDRFIDGLTRASEAIHAAGGKFALQLHFGGLVAMPAPGLPIYCPSLPQDSGFGALAGAFFPEEVQQAGFLDLPEPEYKVMTAEDIADIVGKFADAAVRASQAGADGVEIHGGHGYILSSFLSPRTNRRTDEYGGSIENRARFLIEVLRAVKAAVGSDLAAWCKIDGIEYGVENGITNDDAIAVARMCEAAGADAITVTGYHNNAVGSLHSDSHTPDTPGRNTANAAAIKATVNIPVILSGRIEPKLGDAIIARGEGDFIAMGRKLLADPDLPNKLAADREDTVLPCIYCYTCISCIYVRGTTRCAVNPETGFETLPWLEPAERARRIVVVGGGPAGMEAARRLFQRGHEVTLLERSERLGGTLFFGAIAYEPNERLLDWLKGALAETSVDVRLGVEATPDLLRTLAPDHVVVASGARRDLPAIPGSDQPHVFSGEDMRKLVTGEFSGELKRKVGRTTRLLVGAGSLAGVADSPARIRQASKAWLPLGKSVVIIGADLVGLELAEFLAHRGRRVTVVDDAPQAGRGLQILRRWRMFDDLESLGVPLRTGLEDIAISDKAVTARLPDGEALTVPADSVVVAKGAAGDLSLAEVLRGEGFDVYSIGDCNGVGFIEGAIRSAAELAMKL